MGVDIAIDLGTSRTKIYVEGKGMMIDEPSVVTVDLLKEEIIAFGNEAYEMLGKTSERFNVIYPLSGGVVADFDIVSSMIDYFLHKVGQGKLAMPRVVACIPGKITEVEKRAVVNAISAAGVRKVCLIEEPIAAAIGCEVDINSPKGFLIVDIGGGTTDMAVVSLGGIASSKTIKVAGNEFDEEVIKYLKATYGLIIGKKTAEKAKIEIGCIMPFEESKVMRLKGRDLITGMPKWVDVISDELIDVFQPTTKKILNEIKDMLENTSPELVGDICSDGIHLSGGMANIHGIDVFLSNGTGLEVKVPENPLHAVINGTGKSIKYIGDLDHKSYGALNPLNDEF